MGYDYLFAINGDGLGPGQRGCAGPGRRTGLPSVRAARSLVRGAIPGFSQAILTGRLCADRGGVTVPAASFGRFRLRLRQPSRGVAGSALTGTDAQVGGSRIPGPGTHVLGVGRPIEWLGLVPVRLDRTRRFSRPLALTAP